MSEPLSLYLSVLEGLEILDSGCMGKLLVAGRCGIT
jgi:hypothetical protein